MNVYDQIRYRNHPYAQTHPSRLFVVARLAGLDPPPVETCRVLELGASEGSNLLGMAVALPGASFTGIELAQEPVALGRTAISELGLKNVTLLQMDLMQAAGNLGTADANRQGEFDYIVAHGLYAWTPPTVRDKILEIAERHLSARGLAFVSYNTYPAGYIRKMLREMMLYRTRGIADPAAMIAKARELLRVIAEGRPEPDGFDFAAAAHAQDLLTREDSTLFHDDLGEIYEPVYLHEFVAHAARHGLQYVCDAETIENTGNLKPEAIAAARVMAEGDALAEEQYLDFLRLRRFRQSVLCRAGLPVARERQPLALAGCYAASGAAETADGAFLNLAGRRLTTTHPAPVEYLRRLSARWPSAERIEPRDATLALELYKAGMLDLQGFPGVACAPGDRPCASPLARYQAVRGDPSITTLWHHGIHVEDEESRRALALLDGTRDVEDVAREMNCTQEHARGAIAALGRLALLIA